MATHRAIARTAIIATAAMFLIPTGKALAVSSGCAAVNAGGFNLTYGGGSGPIIPNFDVGDTVHLSVTATSGSSVDFILVGHAGGTTILLQAPAPATVTIPANYTVTGLNNDTSLAPELSGSGNPPEIGLTATCTPAPSPGPQTDASQAVTKGFLASRINGILLNDPGATSLLNRSNAAVPTNIASTANGNTNVAGTAAAFGSAMGLGSGLGSTMGLGAGSMGDDAIDTSGSKSVQFSQSLSQLRRQSAQAQMNKDRMALGAGDGGSLPLAYESTSPWDIWVEGRYSAFDDDNANLDRSGHVGVLYVGGDYRLAENMIVGVLAQFDWAKDESGILQSKVDGNGWMIGPYMSARIHDNIYLDVRAAWGRSSNDLTLGTATGDFDTSRWLVKGTLAGNWTYDAWRITPSADLAYVEESADAFTNSAGTFVAGQDVSLGRLQFGPEIGYRIQHTADTFIEPFAAIKGVWDFDNPNVAIIDGFVVGPGDFWGRLQGGLNVMTASGIYVRGLASWDGLGADDYNGYTLQGTLNVPLN